MTRYQVTIDCAKNDPVDIRAGGPKMLGFDYRIDSDMSREDLRTQLKEICIRNKISFIKIYIAEISNPIKIWNINKIEANMIESRDKGMLKL